MKALWQRLRYYVTEPFVRLRWLYRRARAGGTRHVHWTPVVTTKGFVELLPGIRFEANSPTGARYASCYYKVLDPSEGPDHPIINAAPVGEFRRVDVEYRDGEAHARIIYPPYTPRAKPWQPVAYAEGFAT